MPIKLVILDHDGVVMDSSGDIYEAVWQLCFSPSLLQRKAIPSFLDFLTTFRLPGDQWFQAHDFELSATEISEALRQAPNRAVMFPAVPPFLNRVKEKLQLPIIMISAGDQPRIERQLAVGRIRHHFEIVSGGNSDKIMALSFFCSAFDVKPADTVYVGDMAPDMEHSLEAGVTPVGFTGDCPAMEEILTKAGARHCARSHEELGDLLFGLTHS